VIAVPSVSVRSYFGPEQAETAYRAVNVELIPDPQSRFAMRVHRVELHNLWIQRVSESASRLKHAAQSPTRAFITFLTRPGTPPVTDGIEMPLSGIMRHSLGHCYYERSSGPTSWGAISLPVEQIAAAGIALHGRDLTPPRNAKVIVPPSAAMARFQQLHATAGRLAETAPHVITQPEVARGLEQLLISAAVDCMSEPRPREERLAQGHYATIMRRFRRVLETAPDQALYIPEVCAAIGVPERTLRICCQEQLGTSPKRHLFLRRMHLAQRALLWASPSARTVTEVATQFGFFHFGRFAGDYQAIFGELPSATLRRLPG
jgi:AraC-like DNA-binding protein